MSETLKTSSEKATETIGVSHLETLTEMSGKFNPEKARRLAEQNRPRGVEGEAGAKKGAEFLMAMPEKGEKELSPQEAANEYLSLLDELSQDFTNPYYGEERKGQSHYASNITTELGRKYSDNPHYRWRGYASTEAGETDGTMLRIASADNILANEIAWRTEGEKAQKRADAINEEISQLDADFSKKGKLGKFFGKRKYEKARRALEQSRDSGGVDERTHRQYNKAIEKELAISYDDAGRRGEAYLDFYTGGHTEGERANRRSQKEEINEGYNRRFFGLDDPERAAKVERAIELRQKYEAEWSKKK